MYLELKRNRIFIFLALIFNISCFSVRTGERKECPICNEYRFLSSDSMVYQILDLKVDNTFFFQTGSDLQNKKALGKWIRQKDTLLLINDFHSGNFQLSVKEYARDTNFIDFGLVTNLKDEPIHDAFIIVNDDLNSYDLLLKDYKIPRNSVKSFKITFGTGLISKRYIVKNNSATHYQIKISIQEQPINYIFLDGFKFLVKDQKLYALTAKGSKDSIMNHVGQMYPISLSPIK